MTPIVHPERYGLDVAYVERPEHYNYKHFRVWHLIQDAARTLARRGVRPGAMAPDFVLSRTAGDSLRLADLLDKPVLLHFVSIT